MYWRTYFDKDNVIIKDSTVNLGKNPIVSLYYGGTYGSSTYSRYIFHFPVEKLKQLYGDCMLGDLTNVKHKLVLKPTRYFGNGLDMTTACLATAYDLCLFRTRQDWVEGCGYDFDCAERCDGYISPNCNTSLAESNWFYAKPNEPWQTQGIYDAFSAETMIITGDTYFSGEPIYLQCKAQACDDCLFEMDMTSLVNDLISGDTPNYGFGLAFNSDYEINPEGVTKYLGFYSSETPNFFKPYIETEYINPIIDDRQSFYTDKENTLYLYVNVKGEPTNLDENPIVTIYNEFDDVYTILTGECVSKGIYGVSFEVDSAQSDINSCVVWRDVWSNVKINGRLLRDAEQEFQLKPNDDYYQIGISTGSPKKYGFKFKGIQRNENIRVGDVRKITIDTYEAFEPNKRVVVDNIFYRLYVKEGVEQLDIIPWTPVNIGSCENFIYLYTEWMLPQIYYLDFKSISNQEERTYPEEIKFYILDDNVKC
jgi:hypothetical protein